MAYVEFSTISKHFGNSVAVADLDLQIEQGEFFLAAWALWLWQVHDAAHVGWVREADHRPHPCQWTRCDGLAARGPRHWDRVPELRDFSAYDRL